MPEVVSWLMGLGLERYAKHFADNDIDTDVLIELDDADLERLGVISLGHRKKLLRAIKGLSVYCASKGGVVNLTRALALELAPEVRVNCVCPGYVDTDMVRRDGIEQAADPAAAEARVKSYAPLRRIAQPGEIGKAIAYLAGDEAVFVTGAALQIDGGSTAGHP